jgi:hypothetical protein
MNPSISNRKNLINKTNSKSNNTNNTIIKKKWTLTEVWHNKDPSKPDSKELAEELPKSDSPKTLFNNKNKKNNSKLPKK